MLKEYNMLGILNSHKKLTGSVAEQLCTEPFQPLGPVHLESFDKEACDSLAVILSKSYYSDQSLKCQRLYKKFKAILYLQCLMDHLGYVRYNIFVKSLFQLIRNLH